MKIIKRILVVFCWIFAILAVTVGGVILNGNCFRKYSGLENKELTTWMSKLSDDHKLIDVVIPGSHDSCTYTMNYLGETQHLNIDQQLEIGVRYFDIRVKKQNNDYIIYHSIINGVLFDPIIDSILNFIKNNPTETLLLDFQHFENSADSYVYEVITNKLLPYCIKNESLISDLEFVSNLTIKDVRGKCIIFFGDNSKYLENSFIFSRNNDSCTKEKMALDSYYSSSENGKSSKNFINESIPLFIDKIKNKISKEGNKGLFVLQGQLTDTYLVFGPFSKERSHEKNMNNFIKDLYNKEYFNLINIVMRDFIDESKAFDIIKLNEYKFKGASL